MREIIKSKNSFFYLLLVCSFGIGLQLDIYKYAIIALLLQWLFSFDFSNKFQKLKKNKSALLVIIFYVFYAISFLWSENTHVALTDLLLKTPIFLFPLILASSRPLDKDQTNKIVLAFCLSSLFINLYALGNAYLNYLETGLVNSFYYHRLTLHIHSAYQAMFSCFSIVGLIYLRIRERVIANWLMYVGVTIQLLFVLLLSSRMQILIMTILIPCYFIIRYYKIKRLYLGLTYTAVIFYLGYLFITQPSSLNYRYQQSVSQIHSIGIDNDNSDPRKFIWAEGLKVIKNNWLIGAGAGDAKDLLVARYSELIVDNPTADNLVDSVASQIKQNKKRVLYLKEKAINSDNTYEKQLSIHINKILKRQNKKYKLAFQREYNFHNQYLQTFGAIGIFGLLILFFLLAYPFILSIRNKDYLAMLFLFIVGCSFFTESMLERQAGVAFISFFYTLLIILKFKNQYTPS